MFHLPPACVQLPDSSSKSIAPAEREFMNAAEERLIDPVCKMRLAREQVRESLVVDGESYYFCSVGCRAEFQRHPEDYIRRAPREGSIKHV